MRVVGAKFGLEMCEFLGVDPKYVFRLEIDCPIDAAVTVTVHRYADIPDGTKLAKKYFIVDSGEPEVVTPAPEPEPSGVGPVDEVTSFPHDSKTYRKRMA